MQLLQVKGLSKRFGNIPALADVSFHINHSEILGLIGPNGAGKSTLFECLAGLQPADSGVAYHPNGQTIEPAKTLFYVPDGIAPWPQQTVAWALDFAINFYDGRAAIRSEIIQQLDLQPFLQQPIGSLSKGQRKRALIAFGLLTPHPLLLIDEPLDGLDLRQMRDVASVFETHASQGRTLFLSIHQISDAARFCHRFLLLSSGRICGEGTLAQLAATVAVQGAQNLEEVFLALT